MIKKKKKTQEKDVFHDNIFKVINKGPKIEVMRYVESDFCQVI